MPAYLDHAATTPLRDVVIAAYPATGSLVGNASSVHGAGRSARRVLEEARESLAADLGAHPTEVIFTSGGTEADNLGVVGAFHGATATNPTRRAVAISAVEHHAVLDAAHWLGDHQQADVTELPVTASGILDLAALHEYLAGPATPAVLALMWANNETGACQPIAATAAACTAAGVPLHVDAVQAIGHAEVAFATSGASTMAISGHKVGAPVGIGALLARRDAALQPILHGGGQERGIRSGTLDVVGAHLLALAVHDAIAEQATESARLARLRDDLQTGIVNAVDGVTVHARDVERLPGHLLLTIEGTDSDAVLFGLDAAGIAASSGSACTAGVTQPSHVLLAMGADEDTARSALRLTLGWNSTRDDIDAVIAAIGGVVQRARAARGGR